MLLALVPLVAPTVAYQPWAVTVEIAYDCSPISPPSGGSWTSLGAPRSFNITRGKNDKLGDYQAGSASVEIDNSSFLMDQLNSAGPLYNHALPGTPVRIQATKGSTTVTLFSGYTLDGFEPAPDGPLGGGSTVARLTDWMGWAASVQMPASAWAAWVSSTRPELWITGDSQQHYVDGTYPAYNMAQLWNGAGGNVLQTSGTGVGERTSSIVPDDNGYALRLTNNAMTLTSDLTLSATGQWGVSFWMKDDGTGAALYGVIVDSSGSGGNSWSLGINASGYPTASVKVAGSTYTAQIAIDHNDNNPHLITMTVVSTGGTRAIYLGSDLGFNWPAIAGSGVSGGGAVRIKTASNWTRYIDDVCYWTTGIPVTGPTSTEWATGSGYGATRLWYGNTISDRLTNQVLASGIPTAPTWDIDLTSPSYPLVAGYTLPSNLADAVKRMGDVFMGAAYAKRDGSVRVRDASYTSTNADDYSTVQAQFSDDPVTLYPPLVIRPGGRHRTGTRQDKVINDITVNYAGHSSSTHSPIRVFDAASMVRYGRRPKSYTSEVEAGAEATLLPYINTVLANSKDPHVEISDVTLRPYGDQAASDFLMQKAELDRLVTYRETTATGTTIVNYYFRIIGEQWSWSQGLDNWQVTLRLATI